MQIIENCGTKPWRTGNKPWRTEEQNPRELRNKNLEN
jgi:hypothetical protein